MKVFLIGMPGAGKTTIGKLIAQKRKLTFFDLDAYIESKYKTSISEIFQKEGESRFREMEMEALDELIQKKESLIIATGGGTACLPGAMEKMNASGITVWLNPSLETLKQRLHQPSPERPLLFGKELDDILQKLLSNRESFYRESRIKYDVPFESPEKTSYSIDLLILANFSF